MPVVPNEVWWGWTAQEVRVVAGHRGGLHLAVMGLDVAGDGSRRISPHVLLGNHPGLAAMRDTDGYRLAHEEARLALALGRAVYARRTELGMSRAELARRAGMRQPAVSRIESGGGGIPTLGVLNRLGHALGLRFRIIVGEGDAGAAETELLATV